MNNLSDDLKLIKQFEREIGIELKRVFLHTIGKEPVTGFAADNNGWVNHL